MGNLGFFNSALYAVGTASGDNFPSDWLYDITQGENGRSDYQQYGFLPGYFNGYGYSDTTGSGSIWGAGFAAQILIGQTQPGTPPRPFWFNTPKVARRSIEVNWVNSVNSVGYVMELYHQGPYWKEVQTFVTKETELAIGGLLPNTQYNLYGWSINASGSYAVENPIQFQTPK